MQAECKALVANIKKLSNLRSKRFFLSIFRYFPRCHRWQFDFLLAFGQGLWSAALMQVR
jgi:hypothetical protein